MGVNERANERAQPIATTTTTDTQRERERRENKKHLILNVVLRHLARLICLSLVVHIHLDRREGR